MNIKQIHLTISDSVRLISMPAHNSSIQTAVKIDKWGCFGVLFFT